MTGIYKRLFMCYNIGAVQRAAFFLRAPARKHGQSRNRQENGPKKAVAGAATRSAKIFKIINIIIQEVWYEDQGCKAVRR